MCSCGSSAYMTSRDPPRSVARAGRPHTTPRGRSRLGGRQSRPHLKAGLKQRQARARRSVLVDGSPARSDRRVLRARQSQARVLDRDRRLSAKASLPVLVPAHPRRGLRVRPTIVDGQKDAPARARRRRPTPPRRSRRLVDQHQDAHRQRELALQAQRAYERTVADWQAAAKVGASATPGRASKEPSKG
jgi:hypothetical protein